MQRPADRQAAMASSTSVSWTLIPPICIAQTSVLRSPQRHKNQGGSSEAQNNLAVAFLWQLGDPAARAEPHRRAASFWHDRDPTADLEYGLPDLRSAERRVGNGCGSMGGFRGERYH